jgi:hypothetical protein
VNGIRTDLTANGLTLAVAARPVYAADGSITTPGFVTDVTNAVTRDNSWDTQRRRKA